ncbi:MAG: hypothetical protein IIY55_10990 [Blautia sp.]|nr:hypothetical protein [Blautia sp.]
MKKHRRFLLVLLCCLLAWTSVSSIFTASTVQAATSSKTGLKRFTRQVTVNGKTFNKNIYYYVKKNGTRAKKEWVTIKGNKYYFDYKGYAITAPISKTRNQNISIVNQKIGNHFYGFDQKGRMLKGLYVVTDITNPTKSVFAFYNTKTGIWDKTISKNFNNASKYESNSAALKKLLKSFKPVNTRKTATCYHKMPGGTDIILTYQNFIVNYTRDKAGKKEIVLGIQSR